MIEFLITLVVILAILGLVWWIIGRLPLPYPVRRIVAEVILVIVAIWYLAKLL